MQSPTADQKQCPDVDRIERILEPLFAYPVEHLDADGRALSFDCATRKGGCQPYRSCARCRDSGGVQTRAKIN